MRINSLASSPIYLLSFAGVLTALFVWSTVLVVIQFLSVVIVGTIFAKNFNFFKNSRNEGSRLLVWFLIYGFSVAIHSLFVAQTYVQWSYVVNVFIPYLLLPCFAIIGSNLNLLIKTLKLLLRFNLPLSFLFLVAGPGDRQENIVYFSYVSAANLYLLFFPLLKLRWKLLIALVTLMGFFWDAENRSNLLNILISFGILFFYMLSVKLLSKELFRNISMLSRYIFLFIPILLVVLGVFGQFNIFEYLKNSSQAKNVELSNDSGRYLGTDSRTGIYLDAKNYLISSGNWIFGGSAAVIYATHLVSLSADYDSGRLGGSESGLLGLLMFGGLLYVFLFFSLCYYSSKVAITRSNNRILKLVGIFVAYKWLFTFIESPLGLSFSWIILFLAIGMTFNRDLREMSDRDIAYVFRSL